MSISYQCELLGISRSSYYDNAKHFESKDEAKACRELIYKSRARKVLEEYETHSTYGYKKMAAHLQRDPEAKEWATEKIVRTIYKKEGLKGLTPKFNTSKPGKGKQHQKFPYLLRGKKIQYVNQVWSTDITYFETDEGRCYITAVIDWFSRKILAIRTSDTMDTNFCIDCVQEAIKNYGTPAIFNTDQGSSYTAHNFVNFILSNDIELSMDGKGRCLCNAICERSWRTLKYEYLFLREWHSLKELKQGAKEFMKFYNDERIHMSLGYRTPSEVYDEGCFLNIEEVA